METNSKRGCDEPRSLSKLVTSQDSKPGPSSYYAGTVLDRTSVQRRSWIAQDSGAAGCLPGFGVQAGLPALRATAPLCGEGEGLGRGAACSLDGALAPAPRPTPAWMAQPFFLRKDLGLAARQEEAQGKEGWRGGGWHGSAGLGGLFTLGLGLCI